MPLPREQVYTTDDIYALPDGERAELIDGQIYMMGTPSRIHQKLVGQLSRIIGNYIESNHGSCEIYPAPFAVFIKKDDKNYVEPDISVICDKSKLSDRGCEGAPDFIIEIVNTQIFAYDMYGQKIDLNQDLQLVIDYHEGILKDNNILAQFTRNIEVRFTNYYINKLANLVTKKAYSA